MKEPRLPPITLWGLRSGGFLKDPVYWCRKECMLCDVGGLPFFTIGSLSLLLFSSMVICSASSDNDSSIVWLPRSVRDSLLLNFFILPIESHLKNPASAGSASRAGATRGKRLCDARDDRMQFSGSAAARALRGAGLPPPPPSGLPRAPHAVRSPPVNMAPGSRAARAVGLPRREVAVAPKRRPGGRELLCLAAGRPRRR